MLPFTIPDAVPGKEAGFPGTPTVDLATPKVERTNDGNEMPGTWNLFDVVCLAAGAPRRNGFAGECHAC